MFISLYISSCININIISSSISITFFYHYAILL